MRDGEWVRLLVPADLLEGVLAGDTLLAVRTEQGVLLTGPRDDAVRDASERLLERYEELFRQLADS